MAEDNISIKKIRLVKQDDFPTTFLKNTYNKLQNYKLHFGQISLNMVSLLGLKFVMSN